MRGGRLVLRAEARGRWRVWLGVALVLGLAAGTVLMFVSGARRTASAYDRFLAGARPSDVLVQDSADFGGATVDLEALRNLPQLDDATIATGYYAYARLDGDRLAAPGSFFTMSDPTGRLGRDIDRWQLLSGRRAVGEQEVVLGFDLARRWEVEVGDTIELGYIRADTASRDLPRFVQGIPDRLASPEPDRFDYVTLFDGPRSSVEVVGIAADPLGFPPQSGNLVPLVYLDPAVARTHGDALWSQRFLYGLLAEGSSSGDFVAAAEQSSPGTQIRLAAVGRTQAANVQRVIDLDARALWVLAGVLAVSTLVILGQLVARLTNVRDADRAALRSLGANRTFLRRVSVGRAFVVALAALPVAVFVAWFASSRFPVGVAAAAEPSPGRDLDPTAMTACAVLLLVVAPAAAWCAASWQSRSGGLRRRPPLLPQTRRRLRPAVLAGLTLTRPASVGPEAVPIRSSVGALTAGVAALVLVVTFGASLSRFLDTPKEYGWNWDVQIGAPGVPDLHVPLLDGLDRNAAVRAVAVGTVASLDVDGHRVDALAVADEWGSLRPTMVDGEPPVQRHEIALGPITAQRLGVAPGDTVTLSVGDRTLESMVTGRVVLPEVGDDGQLGRGAYIPFAGLEQLVSEPTRNIVLVSLEDASDAEAIANIRQAVEPYPVLDASEGNELLAHSDAGNVVGDAPRALLAAPAIVVLVTLVHLLATSISRRRREIAVLRSLGFGTREVLTAVLTQGTLLVAVALAFGVPLGIIAGRTLWSLFGRALGVATTPVVPIGLLACGSVALVVLAGLIALVPAMVASRIPASAALRAE